MIYFKIAEIIGIPLGGLSHVVEILKTEGPLGPVKKLDLIYSANRR
jgi:hypothetical protein